VQYKVMGGELTSGNSKTISNDLMGVGRKAEKMNRVRLLKMFLNGGLFKIGELKTLYSFRNRRAG